MKRQHKDGLNINRDMAFSSKCETPIFEFQTRDILDIVESRQSSHALQMDQSFISIFYNFCFLHHSYKLNVLCFVDLEQREDAARVNKENDEMAAKNLQAEVS